MAGAGAGHAPRQDLAALLKERLEHLGVLVVDEIHAFHAEAADFLLADVAALPRLCVPPPGPPPGRPAGREGGPEGVCDAGAFSSAIGILSLDQSLRWPAAACWSPLPVGVALRGRRAARRSRRRTSFCCRLISSSRRTVRYFMTESVTLRRRSSSLITSPWVERRAR